MMTIDEWAKKIVADIAIGADERAPADTVIFKHLDAFEEIARRTGLKIPAFARALSRAGLTLRSGDPYSAETLRAQINRARARRERIGRMEASESRPPVIAEPRLSPNKRAAAAPLVADPVPSEIASASPVRLSMLEKIRQSKPRRPKLGLSED